MKKGLGKSLDEIISAGVRRPLPAQPGVPSPINPPDGREGPPLSRLIPVSKVSVNPRQPRRQFKEEALKELAASIKEHGVLQPISVRQNSDGTFELIAGERRYRAVQLAGLT